MANLVTLAEAKKQLRVTWNDEDTQIQLVLDGSEASILNYIKKDYGWTAENVPADVKLAILGQLSTYYDLFRDGTDIQPNSVALGYFSPFITALLHRYRPIVVG